MLKKTIRLGFGSFWKGDEHVASDVESQPNVFFL